VPMYNFLQGCPNWFKLWAMKKLCPNCELWLVKISVSEGEGSFFCLRWLDQENRSFIETRQAFNKDNDFPKTLISLGLPENK
jgi:hypothetical protein